MHAVAAEAAAETLALGPAPLRFEVKTVAWGSLTDTSLPFGTSGAEISLPGQNQLRARALEHNDVLLLFFERKQVQILNLLFGSSVLTGVIIFVAPK
jgi:hypothetical protein